MPNIDPDDADFLADEIERTLHQAPQGVIVIQGFLGEAFTHLSGSTPISETKEKLLEPAMDTELYWRLYLTPLLNEYIEFRDADVLFYRNGSIIGQLTSKIVWLRKDAKIQYVHVEGIELQRRFLQGDITKDYRFESYTYGHNEIGINSLFCNPAISFNCQVEDQSYLCGGAGYSFLCGGAGYSFPGGFCGGPPSVTPDCAPSSLCSSAVCADMAPATVKEQPQILEQAQPSSRYADFTFLRDVDNEPFGNLVKIPDGHPLQLGIWYQLAVAIRENPTGIPSQGPRQPVVEPKQKHDVTITVTAASKTFHIEEPVGTLTLPPEGDSTVAYFRVCPQVESASAKALASITIRLFYQFNLIEAVYIEAEVVGEADNDSISQYDLPNPLSFRYDRQEGDYDIDTVNTLPRNMHIDITRDRSDYVFTFTFHNSVKNKIELTGPISLTGNELESNLVDIREKLLRIAMSDIYSTAVDGIDNTEFAKQMGILARLGRRLWSMLFERKPGSALYFIGQWLRENPLQNGDTIQVSVAKEASDFLFPWNLMFDGSIPADSELPDLERFWGLRYVIEQRVPTPYRRVWSDAPITVNDGVEFSFMLWPFDQAPQQTTFITNLLNRSKGQLYSGEPITDKDTAYALLANCKSQVLYFYTHGKTRVRKDTIGNVIFTDFYKELPPNLQERWKDLYNQTKEPDFDVDSSWIKLEYGTLDLDTLYIPGKMNLLNRPIVFLNMCESAQITPSLSDGFVYLFMSYGACCVIGTECSMRPLFAHHFSQEFFSRLFSGNSVGQILVDVRQEYIKRNNPLGLAYTLFGSVTVRFEPPPLSKADIGNEGQ